MYDGDTEFCIFVLESTKGYSCRYKYNKIKERC